MLVWTFKIRPLPALAPYESTFAWLDDYMFALAGCVLWIWIAFYLKSCTSIMLGLMFLNGLISIAVFFFGWHDPKSAAAATVTMLFLLVLAFWKRVSKWLDRLTEQLKATAEAPTSDTQPPSPPEGQP